MAYSVEAHLRALKIWVDMVTPNLSGFKEPYQIMQPGLARALIGLCRIDMTNVVPPDPVSRQEYLDHMHSIKDEESSRFDEAVRPFYDRYAGLLGSPLSRLLPNATVNAANIAIHDLVLPAALEIEGGMGYQETIGLFAGRLAIARHVIISSHLPQKERPPFPPLDTLAFDKPKRWLPSLG